MHEGGLAEYFLRRSLQKKLKYRSTSLKVQKWIDRQSSDWHQSQLKVEQEGSRLSLTDLQSVFVLSSLGFIASSLVLTIEFLNFFCEFY